MRGITGADDRMSTGCHCLGYSAWALDGCCLGYHSGRIDGDGRFSQLLYLAHGLVCGAVVHECMLS